MRGIEVLSLFFGGWPLLRRDHNAVGFDHGIIHTGGAPSFACFSRRVGGRRIAAWALPFTLRAPAKKFSSTPHSRAPPPTRPEDRSDNYSSAKVQVIGAVVAMQAARHDQPKRISSKRKMIPRRKHLPLARSSCTRSI